MSASARLFDEATLDDIRQREPLSSVFERMLGTKMRKAGRTFMCLCPFHPEKTPSCEVDDSKGLFMCFGCASGGDAIEAVMRGRGVSFPQAVEALGGVRELSELDRKRIEKVKTDRAREAAAERQREVLRIERLWNECEPIRGTLVETYFESRGLAPQPVQTRDLRFHPALRYHGVDVGGERRDFGAFPAMVAAIRDASGDLIGLHRTYLDPAGDRKLKPPGDPKQNRAKKITGEFKGGLIWLGPPADRMVYGEGIETTLSWATLVGADAGYGFASAVSINNLCGGSLGTLDHPTLRDQNGRPRRMPDGQPDPGKPGYLPPPDVREVVYLGDGDSEPASTRMSLLTGARRAAEGGRAVFVSMAPDGADWNNVLQANETAEPGLTALADFERQALIRAGQIKEDHGFATKLGLVLWQDLGKPSNDPYEELVAGWLTSREVSLLAGESQGGKTFFAVELAMAVARGVPFLGKHRVQQGLVVYQAGEGSRGLRDKRIPAYRLDRGLSWEDKIPLAVIPRPIDLFHSDDHANALIEDTRAAEKITGQKCRLLIIDTSAAATPGADENSGKDVGPVLARCYRIANEVGCAVILVTHMNAGGQKVRGWTGFVANVDTVMVCRKGEGAKDVNGRPIREVEITKQKDGESGAKHKFVLRGVQVAVNEYNEPVYSCVLDEPDMGALADVTREPPIQGQRLPDRVFIYFTCVREAVQQFGEAPPADLHLPTTVSVVHKRHVAELFAKRWLGEDDDPAKNQARIRQARKVCGERLVALGLIGSSDPYVWLTGKKVRGVPTGVTSPHHAPVTPSASSAPALPDDDDEAPF